MSLKLSSLIESLGYLSYDELTDLIFLVERNLLTAKLASSNKTEQTQSAGQLKLLQLGRKGVPYERLNRPSKALEQILQLTQDLNREEQEAAIQIAKAFKKTLQPIEKRRKYSKQHPQAGEEVAKGNIEIKYIKVPVYDFETGLRAKDEHGNKLSRGPGPTIGPPKEIPGFGPYLYVRVWATGGGMDRALKRQKSKYVGLKGLAMHLEELFDQRPKGSPERKALAEEIIDRYIEGTLHKWATMVYPEADSDGDRNIGDDSSMTSDS